MYDTQYFKLLSNILTNTSSSYHGVDWLDIASFSNLRKTQECFKCSFHILVFNSFNWTSKFISYTYCHRQVPPLWWGPLIFDIIISYYNYLKSRLLALICLPWCWLPRYFGDWRWRRDILGCLTLATTWDRSSTYAFELGIVAQYCSCHKAHNLVIGRVVLCRQVFPQSPRLVFELTTGRYRMVVVQTAIEKPVGVKILGLERLVGVEMRFDFMNARQSPRGSKEMGARSEGYNFLPFWWFQ